MKMENEILSPKRHLPRSLVGKAFWVLRRRPSDFFSAVRGYILFLFSGWVVKLLWKKSLLLKLGKNVRIQSWSAVQIEKPHAKIEIGDHCVIYENARLASYG